jgi:hypothetical protein
MACSGTCVGNSGYAYVRKWKKTKNNRPRHMALFRQVDACQIEIEAIARLICDRIDV